MDSIIVNGIGKRYHIAGRMSFGAFNAGSGKKRATRELWALKNVSFSLRKGNVLGIIGRNGAGKTTLLKILARITAPTEGSAVIRGRVVSLLELGLGFQPELTARENIFLNAVIYDIDRNEVERYFDEIISFAGIEKFVDTPLKHFSSGMYLRLAFSAAVNMRPDILLADEILAVGDIGFQEECLNRLAQAGKSGVTILFVSHDMATVQRLCGQSIHIEEGTIVNSGDSASVIANYQNALLSPVPSRKAEAQRNKYGELISVQLLSKDLQIIGAVRTDESCLLEIIFEILSVPAQMSLEFVVTFYAKDTVAFKSVTDKWFKIEAPGKYAARVEVPKHLLAELEYSVKVGVVLRVNKEEHILVMDNALRFRVYSGIEELNRNISELYRFAGVVKPLLKWDFLKK